MGGGARNAGRGFAGSVCPQELNLLHGNFALCCAGGPGSEKRDSQKIAALVRTESHGVRLGWQKAELGHFRLSIAIQGWNT